MGFSLKRFLGWFNSKKPSTTKLDFDSLLDIIDPLYKEAVDAAAKINDRRKAVEALHVRPTLKEIVASPALRAGWLGLDAPAFAANSAALAPFIAEDKALCDRLTADIEAVCVANGWTSKELIDEIVRRAPFRTSEYLQTRAPSE